MTERFQENKLKGFKKAAGTAVLAISLAACSSNASETPKPSIVPTEKPTPTVTFAPTPEVTPTPTPEPTPTPTPEPTPMPVASILEGEHSKPDVKVVAADIKTVLDSNPQVLVDGWTTEKLLNFWKYCQKGDPEMGGDPNTNKQLNCQNLIVKFYQDYRAEKDQAFYNVAKEVYDYAVTTLPKDYVNNLNSNLEQFLN